MVKGLLDLPHDKKVTIMRVFQFVVYAWALRLSFVAVGSVMVSMFQVFVPNDTIGIKIQHIPIFGWQATIDDEYQVMQMLKQPVLFTDVNVISPALLKSKLERVTPILSTNLKTSTTPEYVHYSSDRLWSTKYENERNYEYIPMHKYLQSAPGQFHPCSLLDHLRTSNKANTNTCASNECSKPSYIYGTHNNALPYLQALSPGFAQYLALEDRTPQVCMWVSTPEVAAAMHYDLEDNFLLQISGTKRVIIVSPESLPAMQPYSSYHPHWRQALNSSNLYTTSDVIERLERFVDRTSKSIVHTSSVYGEMKVWEVTLVPGCMVYIPAGFYHTITTGIDSLTINAWFTSELSALHTTLSNIPLPYSKTNTVTQNVNNLSAMIRTVLHQLRTIGLSVDLFAETFAQRFTHMVNDGVWGDYDRSLLCLPGEVRHQGK